MCLSRAGDTVRMWHRRCEGGAKVQDLKQFLLPPPLPRSIKTARSKGGGRPRGGQLMKEQACRPKRGADSPVDPGGAALDCFLHVEDFHVERGYR